MRHRAYEVVAPNVIRTLRSQPNARPIVQPQPPAGPLFLRYLQPSRRRMRCTRSLPTCQLQIGVLLALLQDDAKNQASYLTWKEKVTRRDVARILRQEFLVTEERADKLSGAWGRHPLMGRMYLPAYRSGTERVAALRRRYKAEKILPALYGCNGIVDIRTVESAIETEPHTKRWKTVDSHNVFPQGVGS